MSKPVAERQTYLKQLFSGIHQSNEPTDDLAIDSALGLDRERVESGFTLGKLLVAHGNHRVETGDIPYSAIRDLYRALNVPPDAPLLDLGAGYGRIGFYGAVLWNQPVHGIEIVPERVMEARRVQSDLRLTSLRFEIGDLLTAPWPEVSHFLMLNSVFPSLMPPVVQRLARIARSRRITVVSVSSSNRVLEQESWLEQHKPALPSASPPAMLRVFTSR